MNFYIFIMDIILAQGYDIISIDYLKAISIMPLLQHYNRYLHLKLCMAYNMLSSYIIIQIFNIQCNII